jgi:predicted nucleotidyltransferase
MPELERLGARLVELLQEEYGAQLLGVLLTGSRVHGRPGPTSDLDVHVLIEGVRRRRKNIMLDGMEIEMFINPTFQVARYFDEGPATMHMYALGRIIYDPQGRMAEIQALARARWEAGPPPIKPLAIWRHRYLPADLLRDLEDIGTSDLATSALLIGRTLELLLEAHGALSGHWLEKPKRRVTDLERWDPAAAALTRAALECGPLKERVAALRQLADHVLTPLGGLMPLEWETEWEEMIP